MTTTAEPTVESKPGDGAPEAKKPSDPTDDAPSLQAWQGPLVVENSPTGDRRRIMPGALTARDLPLPLMFQSETPAGGLGGNPHAGARAAGHIDLIWPGEDGQAMGAGVFDTGEAGIEAARMRRENTITGLSVDLDDVDAEVVETRDGHEELQITKARIMGVTMVPFPAIPGAQISLIDADEFAALSLEHGQQLAAEAEEKKLSDNRPKESAVTAAGGPALPPEEWFANPELAQPTPFTITDDGRVYGHAAQWNTCHISYQQNGTCVTAPHSASGYGHFTVGATRAACCCDDPAGEAEIPTGPITLGTTHASEGLRPSETNLHYENTGMVVADVAAGEDSHGIWVAGALRPGLSDDKIRELRGAALSGDWRKIGGNLELVGVLAVNVPGFGIPRTKFHTKAGSQTSLVAAGIVEREPLTPTDALEMLARNQMATDQKVDQIYKALVEPVLADKQMERFNDNAAPMQFSIEMIEEAYPEGQFRDFNTAQRKSAAKSGAALPDGSFPIHNCSDWNNARRAIGRAAPGKRARVQAHINSRGKALGCKAAGD